MDPFSISGFPTRLGTEVRFHPRTAKLIIFAIGTLSLALGSGDQPLGAEMKL
jgi:hypothetical protein